MGLFDLFKKKEPDKAQYAQMLSGMTPIFSQFGQDIYASDVVKQCIHCIATEVKKLTPQHEKIENRDIIPINDSDIQRVLENPNPIMTTSDLLEKMVWQLFLNYNSFIVPTYIYRNNADGSRSKKLTGLYPVQPVHVDFLEYGNDLYIKMRFANNYETTLLYSDIIHIRYEYSVSEYMGGNIAGQPDNKSLLKTLQINNDLLEGVAKGVRTSFATNGVVHYKTIDREKAVNAVEKLEEHLRKNESGFMPLDMNAEFTQIKRDIKLVDNDTLRFIDEKILRHYGVSLPILLGKFTREDYSAFYQKTIESIVISIGQAFTKGLFTEREIGHKNKINFYPEELIFMNTEQVLEMINLFGQSGTIYENEKRRALGLPPLPELVGKRMQSLNYIDATKATEYQLKEGGKKGDRQDEKKEE